MCKATWRMGSLSLTLDPALMDCPLTTLRKIDSSTTPTNAIIHISQTRIHRVLKLYRLTHMRNLYTMQMLDKEYGSDERGTDWTFSWVPETIMKQPSTRKSKDLSNLLGNINVLTRRPDDLFAFCSGASFAMPYQDLSVAEYCSFQNWQTEVYGRKTSCVPGFCEKCW